MAETSWTVALEIPPGAEPGERAQLDLRGAGIENLVLDVTIVVALRTHRALQRKLSSHATCRVIQPDDCEQQPSDGSRLRSVLWIGQDSLPQRVDHLFRLVLRAGDAGFGDQSANLRAPPSQC